MVLCFFHEGSSGSGSGLKASQKTGTRFKFSSDSYLFLLCIYLF